MVNNVQRCAEMPKNVRNYSGLSWKVGSFLSLEILRYHVLECLPDK